MKKRKMSVTGIWVRPSLVRRGIVLEHLQTWFFGVRRRAWVGARSGNHKEKKRVSNAGKPSTNDAAHCERRNQNGCLAYEGLQRICSDPSPLVLSDESGVYCGVNFQGGRAKPEQMAWFLICLLVNVIGPVLFLLTGRKKEFK